MASTLLKQLLPLLITALEWDINFRLTFKNMDAHMDLGSYPTLKYDPLLTLIKNILCGVIYLSIYFFFLRRELSEKTPNKILTIKTVKTQNIISYKKEKRSIFESLIKSHNLNTKAKFIFFCIKIFVLIFITYVFEELYFIVGNIHILDRLDVPMRNISVLFVILVLSSILIKRKIQFYIHQLFPTFIVIGSSLFIILFNAFTVVRFKKVFNINFLYYMILYVLMGIEIVLDKYLTDIEFIDIFLILGLKGVIGTITFTIISILYSAEEFFYLFDKLMFFEYDNMYEDFNIGEKIFYIITIVIFIYLKMYIINEYSESHFLAVAMIADVFFYPLYMIEKFWVQKFPITTSSTFYLNIIFGILNATVLLIFNEIIELKCCGLNKNLKKNIEKRKDMEMKFADENTNLSEDFNSSERNTIE